MFQSHLSSHKESQSQWVVSCCVILELRNGKMYLLKDCPSRKCLVTSVKFLGQNLFQVSDTGELFPVWELFIENWVEGLKSNCAVDIQTWQKVIMMLSWWAQSAFTSVCKISNIQTRNWFISKGFWKMAKTYIVFVSEHLQIILGYFVFYKAKKEDQNNKNTIMFREKEWFM